MLYPRVSNPDQIDIESIRSDCNEETSHPGKFEGEYIYAPYFYALSMEGEGEPMSWSDGTLDVLIPITYSDRKTFSTEIEPQHAVAYVTEDDQGFVSVYLLTLKQAEDLQSDNQKDWEANAR